MKKSIIAIGVLIVSTAIYAMFASRPQDSIKMAIVTPITAAVAALVYAAFVRVFGDKSVTFGQHFSNAFLVVICLQCAGKLLGTFLA